MSSPQSFTGPRVEMESFKIFVSVFADDIIILDVDHATTVIEVIHNIPCFHNGFRDYLLLFRGRNVLEEVTAPLVYWGIVDQSHLVVSKMGLFGVHVRSRPSYCFPVEVQTLELLWVLKEKIQLMTGVPILSQSLHFSFSKMHDDNLPLAFYGIFHPGDALDQCRQMATYGNYVIDLHSDCCQPFLRQPFSQTLGYPDPSQPSPAASSDCKIVVEIPVGDRANVYCLTVNCNLMDTINTMKTKLCNEACNFGLDGIMDFIHEGQYVLMLNRKMLEGDSFTLNEFGIENKDRLVLCPNFKVMLRVVQLLEDKPSEMKVHAVIIECYETVGALKERIKRIARISPDKQILLRFEKRWLAEDHELLVEQGIVEFHDLGNSNHHLRKRRPCIVEALTYGA